MRLRCLRNIDPGRAVGVVVVVVGATTVALGAAAVTGAVVVAAVVLVLSFALLEYIVVGLTDVLLDRFVEGTLGTTDVNR